MHERTDLNNLIDLLKKEKKGIWKRAAELLSKPRRTRVEVNLSKIDKYASQGSTILIPGKVLGAGRITKKITIAAFSFSESAKKTIVQGGADIISINKLFSQNPSGKSIIILI
ncbi:MAG: 50S ribosomal protein L18e [Candidatus Micrarchaeota archaeon]